MTFELHPSLAKKTSVIDLPLCRVLLEDERHYPWIILVPRRPNLSRIMDLPMADQQQLLIEMDWAQKIVWEQHKPTQLNIAALGNKTPQLHVHIIARFADDPAWPGTVWDHPCREKYSAEQKEHVLQMLREAFANMDGMDDMDITHPILSIPSI